MWMCLCSQLWSLVKVLQSSVRSFVDVIRVGDNTMDLCWLNQRKIRQQNTVDLLKVNVKYVWADNNRHLFPFYLLFRDHQILTQSWNSQTTEEPSPVFPLNRVPLLKKNYDFGAQLKRQHLFLFSKPSYWTQSCQYRGTYLITNLGIPCRENYVNYLTPSDSHGRLNLLPLKTSPATLSKFFYQNINKTLKQFQNNCIVTLQP